jgi:DMSO/TMAO reductase YedYZ heme-binding membrane subunit
MNHAYWYATRGTGVAALVMLTLVVALGVAGSLRLRSEGWPRVLVLGLHRNLSLLALVFLCVHVGTTVLDSYTPIHLQEAFVPFVGHYRPIWLGLGAVAFDLLLALTITSLVRARIGHRTWRSLHWLAYAAWPVALAHGLGTGSDARFGWLQAVAAACVLTVLAGLAFRLVRSGAPPARRALAAAGATVVVLVGVTWYADGPARHGWAARAGTADALLAKRSGVPRTTAATAAARPVSTVPAPPFDATLDGRLTTRTDGSGLVQLDIRGHTSGGVEGLLWIRLQGQPVEDGGVSMTASGARFGTASDPNLYVGTIRELEGTRLVLGLRDAAGKRIDLHVDLQVDPATGRVAGALRGAAADDDEDSQ